MLRLVIRVVLALALVGALLHEGGQILFAQTKADDLAQNAAQTGAEVFSESKSQVQARAAAAAEVAEPGGARMRSFILRHDGKATVSVVVRASTLIVRRVSFLRRFGVRRATVTAGPPVL